MERCVINVCATAVSRHNGFAGLQTDVVHVLPDEYSGPFSYRDEYLKATLRVTRRLDSSPLPPSSPPKDTESSDDNNHEPARANRPLGGRRKPRSGDRASDRTSGNDPERQSGSNLSLDSEGSVDHMQDVEETDVSSSDGTSQDEGFAGHGRTTAGGDTLMQEGGSLVHACDDMNMTPGCLGDSEDYGFGSFSQPLPENLTNDLLGQLLDTRRGAGWES